MPDFVMTHGLDDRPAPQIIYGQLFEVTLQMTFDLALGLGDEAQAGAIPQQRGEGADAERACIPEWVQDAGTRAQFLEPGFAPGQMIRFFPRRVEHEFADFGVTREQGLRVVQGLCGHLAGVVHAHEGRGFAPDFG